ncbi:MAG: glycosyltransferase family 4 protein [Minisyncoccota bacterium]
MKIAFIGQKGIPALSGGVEKHVEKLATRLAKSDNDVSVYVRAHYTSPALKTYQNVTLIHTPSLSTKHLDTVTYTLFATIHALFQKYDVVHYHSIGPSIFSIFFRIFRPDVRVIATFHSQDYLHQKWNVFARFCLRSAEKITCLVPNKTIVISETLKQYAEKQYRKTFVCIPNGADVAFESDTTVLNQWDIRPKRYILSVSRLVGHKGIHYLMKAFNELEDTNQLPNNFKLVIVGSSAHSDEYMDFLHLLARGRQNIIFTGEQTGKNLEALFSHAYLFVQPSEDEGLSLALLEAMGHGLMPLVSDISANREAVNNTGAFFPSKNIEALKKQLAYFVNRPDEVNVLGQSAEARIQTHYSWDAIAERTLEVYTETISQYSLIKERYAIQRKK